MSAIAAASNNLPPAAGGAPPPEGAREQVRIPLTQLKRGDRAVVELGGLAQDETKLLCAMGLPDRCEVRVCKSGGVCIVQIEATRLGISADMAARILATPCECYPPPPPREPGP